MSSNIVESIGSHMSSPSERTFPKKVLPPTRISSWRCNVKLSKSPVGADHDAVTELLFRCNSRFPGAGRSTSGLRPRRRSPTTPTKTSASAPLALTRGIGRSGGPGGWSLSYSSIPAWVPGDYVGDGVAVFDTAGVRHVDLDCGGALGPRIR